MFLLFDVKKQVVYLSIPPTLINGFLNEFMQK